MSRHIGVGVYEDGTVEVLASDTREGIKMSIEEWRDTNKRIELLADNVGI